MNYGIRFFIAFLVCVFSALHEPAIAADNQDGNRTMVCAAVSSNGKWFAAFFEKDKLVRVWDLEKMVVAHSLQLTDLLTTSMLISDDGNELILARRDVEKWDLKTQKKTAFFTIDRVIKVACMGFDRQQGSIIATCVDGIRRLDERTLECNKEFGSIFGSRSPAIHGLAKDTAVMVFERKLTVFDLAQSKTVEEYKFDANPLVLLKCKLKDKPYVVLLTADDHVIAVDAKGKATKRKLPQDAEDMFYSTYTKSLYIIAKDGFLSAFDPIEDKTEKKLNLKGTGLCIALDRYVDRILPIAEDNLKDFRFIDLKDYSLVPIKK